jgi:probable rRNA maturation factor
LARTILEELNHPDKEISILFVDDQQIKALNKQYFQRNRPTNVISFPMAQGEFSEVNPQLLGDVIISVETAMKEARKSGLSFEEEVTFLIIHGILHLMGHDHSGRGRQEMEMIQEELFDKLVSMEGLKPDKSPARSQKGA